MSSETAPTEISSAPFSNLQVDRSQSPFPVMSSHSVKQGHIPRPMNAFIIFRTLYAQSAGRTPQGKLSGEASRAWNSLPPDRKQWYHDVADHEKELHKRAYPGYRYAPKHKEKKVFTKKLKGQAKYSSSARVDSRSGCLSSVDTNCVPTTSCARAPVAVPIQAFPSPFHDAWVPSMEIPVFELDPSSHMMQSKVESHDLEHSEVPPTLSAFNDLRQFPFSSHDCYPSPQSQPSLFNNANAMLPIMPPSPGVFGINFPAINQQSEQGLTVMPPVDDPLPVDYSSWNWNGYNM